MSDRLRAEVWKRDKGACQICKKKLTEIAFIDPHEGFAQELSAIEEIPIFKWVRKCWKCGKETPVVSYGFEVGFNYSIGEIEKLDKLLMLKCPSVRKAYSKSRCTEVIANTCVHCGSLQGNSHIMKDLTEMQAEGEDMSRLVAFVLPNELTIEDLHIQREGPEPVEIKLGGEIHHKDGNWENNDLDNLILLCRDCHSKARSQLGRNVASVRTRKQAREEARVKREKKQTDEWRKNYYAQKNKQYQN